MADPIRIGVLRDVPVPARGDFGMNAMRIALDAINAEGGLHTRPVEFVVSEVERSAAGSHENVQATLAAWEHLAGDESVLGVIGPSTTPAILGLHALIEERQVPVIHWAGTDRACGPWTFQFQAGYFPDEGPALAYHAAHQGISSVACFRGAGDYGRAYLEPFRRSATAAGIAIISEHEIAPSGDNIAAAVAGAKASGADAVVAMGLFFLGPRLAREIAAQGWTVPCMGNCGFALAAARSAEARDALRGWVSTDMFDPHNKVATDLFDAYEARHGERPTSASTCFGYDLARVMLEGIRLAPDLSRAGVREGLERVGNLPSATGGAGSWMGYGPQDRKALKGPRLFLFSRIGPDGVQLMEA